jgi:UDP-N-acetylglucosamine--N-acetylmuramyl-(pentapeptide) pyrophosphoryl-undecaprenol N-acetylglucosamine transferase
VRVLFAGGGSGGHLMPAAATAEALEELVPGARACFLLTDGATDRQCVPALAGFESAQMPAVRWRDATEKVRFPARLLKAAGQAARTIRSVRPHVVMGLGGRNCALPLLIGRAAGSRTALLEANAVPGRCVLMLAPLCDLLAVQWRRAAAAARARRVLTAGLPVRARLFGMERSEAARRLGLSPRRCTLLAMGGSQGALALNNALQQVLPEVFRRAPHLQVLHLTGVDHLHAALRWRNSLPVSGYRPIGFLDRMEEAYAAADFVLSRSGGSTLAELTALGLPSVLVPYPHHADQHQHANAAVLSEAGAAIMIRQSELEGPRLAGALVALANDEARRRHMAEASRRLGRPRAAFEVAAALATLAGFGRRLRRRTEQQETAGTTSPQAA